MGPGVPNYIQHLFAADYEIGYMKQRAAIFSNWKVIVDGKEVATMAPSFETNKFGYARGPRGSLMPECSETMPSICRLVDGSTITHTTLDDTVGNWSKSDLIILALCFLSIWRSSEQINLKIAPGAKLL